MIRLVGRLIRAGAYVLVAAGFLVGIPWASIRFVGWPLPTSVPDGAALRAWFDDPFTPARFWPALSIFGWLLWAALVVAIVMELMALFGRVRLPRIRLATPIQGLAGGLVGATVTALAAPAAHAAASTTAATPAVPDLDTRAATPAADAVAPFYDVVHGDWLSTIADRFLGDTNAYPRIQALNPDLQARDARFPNHIEPGWRLILPADAHDRGIRRHAAGQLHRPAPFAAKPPAPDTGPPSTPTRPTAAAPTPATTASPTPNGTPTTPPDQLDGDGDGHPDVVVGPSSNGAMAGAGLLASLLFAVLTAERRRQRGLYAAGQQPPLPANGRAERELRSAQQPADVERLDLALRSLTYGLADRDALPDIAGVRLVGGDVQVLLSGPTDDPPPPWLDEGTQWALPAYLQPPAAGEPATVLPMLVTIGSRAGRHLLVDLERLGTLSIGGHPYRARDLLRHIACELACNSWSDNVTVIVAGFGDEADTLTEIGPDRIVTAETAGAALATVRAELARRAATGLATAATVLLVANPDANTRATLADLHQTLAQTGRNGIAVVTTVPDSIPVGTAMLTVSDTGQLKADLPGLRQSTDAASVPVDLLEPMAQVFRAAHMTPTTASAPASLAQLPPWDDRVDPAQDVLALFEPAASDTTPTAPSAATSVATPSTDSAVRDQLDEDLAAWHDPSSTPPRVGILGPIEVRMPGVLNDSRHRLYTEMLLYLLTRPTRSATKAAIEDALWYGHPAGETTVRKAISKLRQWLGPRAEGGEWIPNNDDPDGVYRVHDGILLDWHLLLRLRQRGNARAPEGITDLRAALELVRSAPMRNLRDAGPYRRPYTWIGDSDIAPGRVIATVADLAHRVAEHHLAIGDTTTARWAIDQAWHADPDRSFDDLWFDRMRTEHQEGQTAALQQLIAEYVAARDAEVLEDLPTPTYNRIRALISAA